MHALASKARYLMRHTTVLFYAWILLSPTVLKGNSDAFPTHLPADQKLCYIEPESLLIGDRDIAEPIDLRLEESGAWPRIVCETQLKEWVAKRTDA